MRKVLAYCSLFSLCALCLLFLSRNGATAQDTTGKAPAATPAKPETNAKPKTAKAAKKDEEKLKKELESPYKKWMNEEVFWIITEDERAAFKRLNTDEEREQFVENFWLKRDPTPESEENEYREEYYRRVAYANETFASGIPGWKTDRGQIYIKYGAPDERDEHSSGGNYARPIEEGGGMTSTFPFEDWRYRYIPGLGNDINIEFVDTSMSGEYHMTMDPSEKDALLYVPGAGLTMYEQLGLACKQCRFNRTDGTHLGTGSMQLPASMDQFTRMEQFANLQRPPQTGYKDLDQLITTSIKYNLLPMQVRADFIPVTDTTVITNITIQFDRKDLSYKDHQGVSSAFVEVTGRVYTIGRKFVTSFDHNLEPSGIPTEMLDQAAHGPDIFQTVLNLKPGTYKLTVIAKDENSQNTHTTDLPLNVPHLDEDRLSSSSLILADDMEPVDRHNIGKEMFTIGEDKVRPRMPGLDGHPNFKRSDPLYIYWRVYNFEPDMMPDANGVVKKADGQVKYTLIKKDPKGDQQVAEFAEEAADVIKRSKTGPSVMKVQKQLALGGFEPGQYTLKMTAVDQKRNQTVTQTADFTIN